MNNYTDILSGKEKEQNARHITNSVGMDFVLIPSGTFWMYSDESDSEQPVHKVTIDEPFYLGKYPVTQKEWTAIMDSYPSCFEGHRRPVECVTFYHVREFIRRLNTEEETEKYRLPSEDEWEYACRAGTHTRYSFGDDETALDTYGWYYHNSDYMTHPVGQKKPNPWGLYDMHGNVWEWCRDPYYRSHSDPLPDNRSLEAPGSTGFVLRGGSWVNNSWKCESSSRSSFDPNYAQYSLGFRLLRSL